MTAARQDLLEALGQIQNRPAFAHQDIMTITGCGMSDDEVRAHIERCMKTIANSSDRAEPAKRRARRAA